MSNKDKSFNYDRKKNFNISNTNELVRDIKIARVIQDKVIPDALKLYAGTPQGKELLMEEPMWMDKQNDEIFAWDLFPSLHPWKKK